MKQSIEIKRVINKNIKRGDFVYLVDGSALSLKDDKSGKEYYIVFDYPEITGSELNLQAILGEVIEDEINNRLSSCGMGWGYAQDIVVQIGNAKFRTASGMVKKQTTK